MLIMRKRSRWFMATVLAVAALVTAAFLPGAVGASSGYIPPNTPAGSVVTTASAPQAFCDLIIKAYPKLASNPQGCNFVSVQSPDSGPTSSPPAAPAGAVITPGSPADVGPATSQNSCTSYTYSSYKRSFYEPFGIGYAEANASYSWSNCSAYTQWVTYTYHGNGSPTETWCGTWGQGGHNYLNAVSYGNNWNVSVMGYLVSCNQREDVNIYGTRWDGGASVRAIRLHLDQLRK